MAHPRVDQGVAGAGERRARIDALLGADADWQNPAALMDPAQAVGRSPAATALRVETEELVAELHVRRPELVARSGADRYGEAMQHAVLARQMLNYHAALADASPGRVARLLGMRDAMMAEYEIVHPGYGFGQHKGYGLSLIDELYAAYIGGSLPTIRNRWDRVPPGEKGTCFYFQCTRPEALSGGNFAAGRTQQQNVKAVIEDILGHGNSGAMLPGQIEANGAALSARHGGLLFTRAEIDALAQIAREADFPFDVGKLRTVEL